jgi:hypothetical protein
MEGRTKGLIIGGVIGAILGVASAWILLNRPSGDDAEGPGEKVPATADIRWRDLLKVSLSGLTLVRQIAELGRRPGPAGRGRGRKGS